MSNKPEKIVDVIWHNILSNEGEAEMVSDNIKSMLVGKIDIEIARIRAKFSESIAIDYIYGLDVAKKLIQES